MILHNKNLSFNLNLTILTLVGCLLSLASNSHGYVYWRNATQRAIGGVIPFPRELKYLNGLDYLAIEPDNFLPKLEPQINGCAIVQKAVDRYLRKDGLVFDDVKPNDRDDPTYGKRHQLGTLIGLKLSGSMAGFRCESLPHEAMDEEYELVIGSGRANDVLVVASLTATTSWGLIRGLETFSQMVFNLKDGSEQPLGKRLFAVQPVQVRDGPRFKHRGFMLDTARHYISLDNILKQLDAMAFNKLNVFHWHLVDDQSFPYESSTYPQVSKLASFRPKLVYTQEDVKRVIDYAAERGIRVMPELDSPGHSYTLRHVPDILTTCYNVTTKQPDGDFGPVNPTKLNSYKVMSKLLAEFKSVFPDSYFHAGGDEVDFDCWKTNDQISDWMAKRNMSGNYKELSNYYIRRINNLVDHYNRTMVVWQEVFDLGAQLPTSNTVVHVWKYIADKAAYMVEMKNVLEAGYRAILSSCWYLNYIDYGQDWVKFYQCDPAGGPIKLSDVNMVLGGEVCMWTEFVDDTNVISRTWPRASAAAERLWSPKTKTDVGEFYHRLEQMRCRLVYRGIQAEPVNGPGYC